jgi:hypothetical protein
MGRSPVAEAGDGFQIRTISANIQCRGQIKGSSSMRVERGLTTHHRKDDKCKYHVYRVAVKDEE